MSTTASLQAMVQETQEKTEQILQTAADAGMLILVQCTYAPVIQYNPATHIVTDYNASAEQMFGWAAKDLIGSPISLIFDADKFRV